MARLRFMAVALLALAFAGNSTQTARTQCQTTKAATEPGYISGLQPAKPAQDDRSCVIYSLTDMGYDADLGKWIAETIPDVIEPSSWQPQGGSGVLRYYAPKNILMVKQSKSVQSKVDGFLKDLKASMPKPSAANSTGKRVPAVGVVPADYREPALLRTSGPVSEAQPYPVPAAVKQPKHLFHFIIRYEGEGIIDDNVVKFMKWQAQGEKSAPTAPAPVCQPYAAAPGASAAPPTPSALRSTAPGSTYNSPSPTEGTPAPAVNLSEQPTKAPKKKKGKKDDHNEKTSGVTTAS